MNEFSLYSSSLWRLPGFQKSRGTSGLPRLFPGSPPVDIVFKHQLCQAVAKVLSSPAHPAGRRAGKSLSRVAEGASSFCDPHLQLLKHLRITRGCGPCSAGLSRPPRHLRGSAAPATARDPRVRSRDPVFWKEEARGRRGHGSAAPHRGAPQNTARGARPAEANAERPRGEACPAALPAPAPRRFRLPEPGGQLGLTLL